MTDQNSFFNQKNCDRCQEELDGARTTSWFTEQTLCMSCSDEETTIKNKLREDGENPDEYEACGFLPEIEAI